MKGKVLLHNGSEFIRSVTMIGDIEKVTWFHLGAKSHGLDSEVYSSDLANKLELAYEEACTAEFTPQPFFI